MGASVSSIVMPWGKHRKTLEELQQVILEYLASEDYSTDPHVHFSDIAQYGYATLEEFISEIPINSMTELVISRGIDANLAAQIGMRYVHMNETWKKGSLVKLLILRGNNLAILQMDATPIQSRNIFQNVFTIMSYVMFPPLFLLNIVRRYMLTDGSNQFECKFEELQLEKQHLLAYLRRTETGNQNHLVQIHLHGVPEQEQPLALRQTSDDSQTVLKFEPQFAEDDAAFKPQTKTKKKRKRKSKTTEKEIDVVNEVNSQVRTNGFHRTDANLAVKTDNAGFPGAGVSQIDKQFERLAPVGVQRGIEGAYNSCYMDSMLVSMFYTTNIFDFLLVPKSTDSKFSRKTRRILRERVVTPLREIYFCDYESLYVLRQHLSRLNEDLLGSFMDAEQVLYLLCDEVFKEQHFIQYAGVDEDGWGDYMHLMSIDASDPSKVITVQRNLETSFAFNGNIRMASVPNPAFILGMPRSDRELIHYEAVIPNTEIEIKHLLQNADCNFCHGDADWEVQNGNLDEEGPSSCGLSFCSTCVASAYEDALVSQSNKRIVSRKRMKLVAIVCIRGVHFTAFVRSGGGGGSGQGYGGRQLNAFEMSGEPWYFFDSMAGGSSEVQVVPKLEMWLNEVANNPELFYESKNIPELVKRSFADGHLCIYEPICYEN